MKNILFLISAILLISNCGDKKKKVEEQIEDIKVVEDTVAVEVVEPEVVNVDESYFLANGPEPIWQLKISETQIELKMDKDTVVAPLPDPTILESTNLKLYRVKTELGSMDIIIAEKECTNGTTEEKSPYTVTISYKENEGGEAKILEGCGEYPKGSKQN